jgi:hypothetical protein
MSLTRNRSPAVLGVLARASSCDEAGEAHRGRARGHYCHDRNERDAGDDVLDGRAQRKGTNVLAHVYLLEVVGDQMGHMMAGGVGKDWQRDDTSERRRERRR